MSNGQKIAPMRSCTVVYKKKRYLISLRRDLPHCCKRCGKKLQFAQWDDMYGRQFPPLGCDNAGDWLLLKGGGTCAVFDAGVSGLDRCQMQFENNSNKKRTRIGNRRATRGKQPPSCKQSQRRAFMPTDERRNAARSV